MMKDPGSFAPDEERLLRIYTSILVLMFAMRVIPIEEWEIDS
jgi:hypothetical protein